MRHPTRAEQYRLRAERLRGIAEKWVDRKTKEMLERLASDYEHMASQLESLRSIRHLRS